MAVATGHPALDQAIEAAAQKEGVPDDVLEGIWKIESGSSYPNPFKNSEGYGGLFGTTEWDAPTQTQANYAASILANLLKNDKGSLSEALYQYSGGGYSQVPGETTFGIYSPAGGTAASGLNPGTETQQSNGLAPSAGSQTGTSSDASLLSSSGVTAWAERALEILLGSGLILIGLAGIYIALSKTSVAKSIPGAVGQLGKVARSGDTDVSAPSESQQQASTLRDLRIGREQHDATHRETIAAERVKQERAKTRLAREKARRPAAIRKRAESAQLPEGF